VAAGLRSLIWKARRLRRVFRCARYGVAANPPMRACLGVDLEPPHVVEIVVTAAQR